MDAGGDPGDAADVRILALGVLLITHVPWLTLGLLQWMGRA
jgi:hypothetical protein